MSLMPLGIWGERLRILGPLLGHESLKWVAAAVMLCYVLRIERFPLSSIGLHKIGLWDILLAVFAGILMFFGGAVVYSVVYVRLGIRVNPHEYYRLIEAPFWYRFIVSLRASVTEEFLLRSYPFERIRELTGSRLLAALTSWTAFTVSHFWAWGPSYLLLAGFYGAILTLLYLWRRNLPANMLAHWLVLAWIYF